jgi:hypothetical protein
MKRHVSMSVLGAVLMLPAATPGSAQELIQNGGFEYPYPAAFGGSCQDVVTVPDGWCLVPTGTFGLEWTVEWAETVGDSLAGSPGILEIWRGTVVAPATAESGLQNMEFDSGGRPGTANANITIYQAVATCPGANYSLAYSWRPRPGVAASSQTLMVKWADATLATHTGFNLPWNDQAAMVSGAFGLQKLEFIGGGTGDQLGMLLDSVSLVGPDPGAPNACTTINIKPGSDPNSINRFSRGSIPVTIWGSATFDVDTIDPDSLTLGGAGVNTPGASNRFQCSIDDIGSPDPGAYDSLGPPDGYPDLTCHFVTSVNMFAPEDTTATVTMTTCSDGFADGCNGKPSTVVTATDAIRIVKSACK